MLTEPHFSLKPRLLRLQIPKAQSQRVNLKFNIHALSGHVPKSDALNMSQHITARPGCALQNFETVLHRHAGSLHWRVFQENSLPADADIEKFIRLDGLAVRRRRHDQGWSPRQLVDAIAEACFAASGLRHTLTPNQIQAVEEREEVKRQRPRSKHRGSATPPGALRNTKHIPTACSQNARRGEATPERWRLCFASHSCAQNSTVLRNALRAAGRGGAAVVSSGRPASPPLATSPPSALAQ